MALRGIASTYFSYLDFILLFSNLIMIMMYDVFHQAGRIHLVHSTLILLSRVV
ncbi:hypothetical protein BJX99DRAFT_219901 [Aspergillus californicus]